jgi:hypothetical protein
MGFFGQEVATVVEFDWLPGFIDFCGLATPD